MGGADRRKIGSDQLKASWANHTVEGLRPSGIRAIYDRANEIQSTGRRVYHLALGRPDMDTPAHIKDAAFEALKGGMVHYAPTRGIWGLREAVSGALSAQLGWEIDPATEILVTAGASEGLFIAVAATINPGDEILVGENCWLNYPAIAQVFGANAIYYRMPAEIGHQPDLDDIESRIGKRTRMIVVNSPTNPTGSVYSREVIEGIAEIAIENDLLVLSDECYRRITFDDAEHISPACVPGMRDRTVVVDSLSKTYSMTGWRIGYVVGPTQVLAAMAKVHQYACGSVCSFGQAAATVALTSSQACVETFRSEFQKRRDTVLAHLESSADIACVRPRGTFYLYPRIMNTRMTSREFAVRLLESSGVAVVPGSVFGPAGEGHFRISCTIDNDELDEAMYLLMDALPRLLETDCGIAGE